MAVKSKLGIIGIAAVAVLALLVAALAFYPPPKILAQQTVTLAASDVTYSTATLTIANNTGNWWYQHTTPSGGDCVAAYAATTVNLRWLTPGTAYTFKAYSNSACTTEITGSASDAEFTTSSVVLSTIWHIIPEGESVPHTVWLSKQPSHNVTVAVATSGDSDITASPASLTFTSSNWSTPQTVTLSAGQDTDTVPGTGKGDGSYAYGATDVTHTATSSDSDFNNVSSVLKATEGDDDVCSGTTAVGGSGVTSGAIVEDCDTLLAAKDIVNGPGTPVNNWSTGLALNSWTGITVTNSRVTRFNLHFSTYASGKGNIPNTIADLSGLTYLNMQSGDKAVLPGPIPSDLDSLTGLTYLALYNRELTGQLPANIGNLTALTDIFLDGNQLSGTVPAGLWNLTGLESLYLGGNQFTGALPESIGNLTNLELLSLSNGGFSGPLPANLSKLTGLTEFFMDGNQFSGAIPAELGSLTGIATTNFTLNNNQLTGCIPTGWSKYASKINPQQDANGNDVNLNGCLTAHGRQLQKVGRPQHRHPHRQLVVQDQLVGLLHAGYRQHHHRHPGLPGRNPALRLGLLRQQLRYPDRHHHIHH